MLKVLKYVALAPCLLLGTLSFLTLFFLKAPLSDVPFGTLAFAALLIILYGLASWELLRNHFRPASAYAALAAGTYLVSAIYELGGMSAFIDSLKPVFFIGFAIPVTIAGICLFLDKKLRSQG